MEITAVDWLEMEFIKLEQTIGVHGAMYELIEQAKEMEKQQIINAYLKDRPKANINKVLDTWDNAEQYYNQQFKNK